MTPATRLTAIVSSLCVALMFGGCRGGASPPRDAGSDVRIWGAQPSPALEELVHRATEKGPPPVPPVAYAPPARVTVPALPAVDTSWLPRDPQGRPVLLDDGVLRYVVDVDKRDPVFAMARCARLLSGCPQRPEVTGGRSVDACWASVPTCATEQPWTESAACCPARCPELYRRLRELGYGPRDANRRAVESACFNGLREQLEAP